MTIKQETLIESFHNLVSSAIALNHMRRENISESTIRALPVDRFNYEYCTVKIDIGRQAGKIEYIRANSDIKTLVVVRKMIHKEEYRECPAIVMTVAEVINRRHIGILPFEIIYFDEPALLFYNQREQDEVYYLLSRPQIKQTFIHIGC